MTPLLNIQISYPGYFIPLILAVALMYALSLYFKDRRLKENKGWLPYVLSFLRFLSVFGILFLLLMPLINSYTSEKEEPVVVFARDISASISQATPEATLQALEADLDALKADLAGRYEVMELEFAERLKFGSDDSLELQSSNLSAPLEYISEAYEDRNLGAVIYISDGIFNEGRNPLYANASLPVPLYVIPLGDTTLRTDLLIKNALHNRIVYLNDRFNIEVDVQAYNSAGATSRIQLYKVSGSKETLIDSKRINIGSDNHFETFQFELNATDPGNHTYRIRLAGINNEISYENNVRNIYLEVLDARQKILLVADAPHPDLKALRTIIEGNKNYETELAFAAEAVDPDGYDVIIMHNLPSVTNPSGELIDRIRKNKIPTWFIAGATADLESLNTIQDVVKIAGSRENLNNVTPVLNSGFSLFTASENFASRIDRFVPLKSRFGNYTPYPGSSILLSQRIGSVETDYPLLGFADINNHKQAVLTGEGIWRWNLIEYAEFENQEVVSELVMKTLQYISLKEDKRQFRAFTDKKNYRENESIIFDAQLYNASFEPINEPEAGLVVTDDAGQSFHFTFSKSNSYYSLDAGRFPEGNYRYTATTSYNGRNLQASGSFTVQNIEKESFDLTARHDMLYNLSRKYNGQVVYPGDVARIGNLIASDENINTILYQKVRTDKLLNIKWLLALFVFLLGLEWFMRRYFGHY